MAEETPTKIEKIKAAIGEMKISLPLTLFLGLIGGIGGSGTNHFLGNPNPMPAIAAPPSVQEYRIDAIEKRQGNLEEKVYSILLEMKDRLARIEEKITK